LETFYESKVTSHYIKQTIIQIKISIALETIYKIIWHEMILEGAEDSLPSSLNAVKTNPW
jgi:hypothetical protein